MAESENHVPHATGPARREERIPIGKRISYSRRSNHAPAQETALFIFRGGETHSRSVLKAISWRTLGTLDTFAISWFMTGKVAMAGSIAGLEIVTKVAWYYFHERIWAAVAWGRR
jgi:uncharacterized membrane protein